MTSRELIQKALDEWEDASEEGLRAELWVHGFEPSEIVSREILINMLLQIYFGEDHK